jgi:hypothetical protein
MTKAKDIFVTKKEAARLYLETLFADASDISSLVNYVYDETGLFAEYTCWDMQDFVDVCQEYDWNGDYLKDVLMGEFSFDDDYFGFNGDSLLQSFDDSEDQMNILYDDDFNGLLETVLAMGAQELMDTDFACRFATLNRILNSDGDSFRKEAVENDDPDNLF